MSDKRFVQVGDTSIKDTLTGEKYYAPCEDGLLDLLNEQQSTIQRFEEYVFSDERILCYNCLFCQEKDIYEVKCERKGSVDVHGICQYYEKKR